MGWFIAVLCTAATLTFLWLARRTPSPENRRRRGDTIANRYLLYVEPGDLRHFDELLDRDRRASYLAAALEIALIAGWSAIVWQTSELPSIGIVALGIAAFIPLSWAVFLFGTRASLGEGTGRGATSDYLHPVARLYMLGAALFGLVVACWVMLSPSEYAGGTTVVIALVPAWAFVVSEAMVRAVCRAPVDEATPGLRYAAQALRSESMVRGYTAPVVVVVIALGQGVTDQDAFNLIYLVLALLVLLVYVQAKPARYHLRFRARLWPQLRPGEIVSTSRR